MYALKTRVCVISIQGDYRQDGGQQLICVSVEGARLSCTHTHTPVTYAGPEAKKGHHNVRHRIPRATYKQPLSSHKRQRTASYQC